MYLLDTNHFSAILDGNPVIAEKLKNPTLEIVACAIVMGELIFMAEKSKYRDENLIKINNLLNNVQIFPADQNSAKIYGGLKTRLIEKYGPKERKKRGQFAFKQIGISDNDLWIASIGISNNATIVSADKDFNKINSVEKFQLESWLR